MTRLDHWDYPERDEVGQLREEEQDDQEILSACLCK